MYILIVCFLLFVVFLLIIEINYRIRLGLRNNKNEILNITTYKELYHKYKSKDGNKRNKEKLKADTRKIEAESKKLILYRRRLHQILKQAAINMQGGINIRHHDGFPFSCPIFANVLDELREKGFEVYGDEFMITIKFPETLYK